MPVTATLQYLARVWILFCLLPTVGLGGEETIPRNAWPASWFSPPRTASEAGLAKFQESPLLAERVRSGELPPLRDRLPADPIVVEPATCIGRHGGTARILAADAWCMVGLEFALTIDPLVRNVLPNLASGWEYSEGGKTLTLHLRKGLRWSDGHPFTAADGVFWFEHIQKCPEVSMMAGQIWTNAAVTAMDECTLRYSFARPYPFFINELAHHGDSFFAPGHFLKDYLPDFVPKTNLENRARAKGYAGWSAYFFAVRTERGSKVFGVPVMNAFVLKQKGPAYWIYERNPYYPKVDPAGNQLPYLDRLQVEQNVAAESAAAKACTGQLTFGANALRTPDIPLFKLNEKAGGYKTLIWNGLNGADVVIQPNLNCEDLELRTLFQDARFRRALSLAINRDEINTMVYFGHAVPRQTTVIPLSRFYEKEFAEAYRAYRPDEARRLLDEIGLRDRNGDGLRERPGGKPLDITLEWLDEGTPKQITLELLTEYWRGVGLDIRTKQVDSSLQWSRTDNNLMQMTIWHGDRCSDILFPAEPYWFVPMHTSWEECLWALWVQWCGSHGKRGEEPPPAVRQLWDWWTEMQETTDAQRQIELGKNILRSQAENLWTIGTVGLAPQPLVISAKLKNVPARGYWGWDSRFLLPYHLETWFLDLPRP
jgi:peptide/nickel transport system substrate-binding protein